MLKTSQYLRMRRLAHLSLIALLALSPNVMPLKGNESMDLSSVSQQTAAGVETYDISFSPSGSKPIRFIRPDGVILGHTSRGAMLNIQVPAKSVQNAMTDKGVHIGKLIETLPSVETTEGRHVVMKIPFEVTLSNGVKVPPNSEVLIDLSEFAKLGAVQPTGADAGPKASEADVRQVDAFNSKLEQKGVTGFANEAQVKRDLQRRAQQHPQIPLGKVATPKDGVPNLLNFQNTPFNFASPTCGCSNDGCKLSSDFGGREPPRATNGRLGSDNHEGVDFGSRASWNTPTVIAAAYGCVVAQTYNPGVDYGRSIYLYHGNGVISHYAHLAEADPKVKQGQCFNAGERLGKMGRTGTVTARHLHFGVYKDRKAIDPRPHLATTTPALLSKACPVVEKSDDVLSLSQAEAARLVPTQARHWKYSSRTKTYRSRAKARTVAQ